jgi:hypothetical protein
MPRTLLGLKTEYLGFPDFEVNNLMDKEDYFIYLGNKKRNKYSYIHPILGRLANVCCAYLQLGKQFEKTANRKNVNNKFKHKT